LISDIKYYDKNYGKYHTSKDTPDITFLKLGEKFEKFDITKGKYLKKTCRYKFATYADFKARHVISEDGTIR
jgi:hypothetical protein